MPPESTCPVCGAAHSRRMATLHPENGGVSLDAFRCRRCGLLYVGGIRDLSFTALQSIYDPGYIDDQGAMGGTARSLAVLRDATARQMEFVERWVPKGLAVNVGATSEAVRVIEERGWTLRLVEVSAYSAEKARRSWGFDVTNCRIEDYECPPGSVDLVKLGHVIEHLPDPAAAMRHVARMLRPGGVALVDTDDARGLRTRVETGVRRVLGEELSVALVRRLTGKNLRKHYGTLSPPVHLYAFTANSLRRLLEGCGLEVLLLLNPAIGDRTWFPLTDDPSLSGAERAMMRLSGWGRLLGVGDVVVALARKPLEPARPA